MMERKTITISTNIEAGWPTANNRIYTQGAINNMVESVASKMVPVYKDSATRAPSLYDICGMVKKINGLVEAEVEIFDRPVMEMLSSKMASISPVGKCMVVSSGVIMDYELQSFSLSLNPAGPGLEHDDTIEIICQALQELSSDFNFIPRGNSRIFVESIPAITGQAIWLYYYCENNTIVLLEGAKKEVQRFDLYSPDSLPELVNKLRMYFKDTA